MKIRADLRQLTEDQEVTYTTDKYLAGSTSIVVDNAANFGANDFILFGSVGIETAEIVKISSVSGTTLSLATATVYDHPQDTLITEMLYDKMNFFRSATLTGTLVALNGSPQTILPDSIYNVYDDTANATGYAWYQFYNSVSAVSSQVSNAVPYAGFADNSVKTMMDTFYTQISNRERKLIQDADVYRWLNEGYSIARNRLNLSNREYTVPTPTSLTIVSGTAEYDLPDYFSKVRVVTKNDGSSIDFISYDSVPDYNNSSSLSNSELSTRYYLRGTKIGFAPTPTANDTWYLYWQKTSAVLSSYVDYIDLPSANHYFLLDFLMFRASPIIGGNAAERLKNFERGLDEMVVTSHKRDDERARWGSEDSSLA